MTTTIETVKVTHLDFALDPVFRSGIHEIAHIYNVVIELGSADSVGTGFSFAFRRADSDAIFSFVGDFARSLRGEEPSAVRDLWRRHWTWTNFAGHEGPPIMAIATVDSALWDLHAQVLGVPLHALLGTRGQSWPVYASGGSLDLSLDELVAQARDIKSQGFAGYKCRVGSPRLDSDVARVAAVREALGPDFNLMVDANQGWSRLDAARAVRRFDEFDLRWIEEPIDFQDVAGLARLRAESSVPIAAGETAYGVKGMLELIHADAVDILQPDLMRCGGVTPFLSVAAIASAHNVAVMPHLYSDASAHLLGLVPAGGMIEYLPGWFDHLYGRPAIASGQLAPTVGAGLGLRFDSKGHGAVVLAETSAD